MAERLSQLLLLDPLNTVAVVRQLSMFGYSVSKHQIETTPLNQETLIADFLGIINGLVGDNVYRIVAVRNDQSAIACFDVERTDLSKVATVKQLQELQNTEVEDGTSALEDKQ